MDANPDSKVETLAWRGGSDGHVEILDQTRLPGEVAVIATADPEVVRDAICRLAVRGAPAIGVAAAFGYFLTLRAAPNDPAGFAAARRAGAERLRSARPTAVNLAWAIGRVDAALDPSTAPAEQRRAAFDAAMRILGDDKSVCRALARHGSSLIDPGDGVLTYCNTGALATAGEGTALAGILAAHADGKRPVVYACETRPLLQGARLTMWELVRAGVDATLVCDNTAAVVLRSGRATKVFVGADRIARNGDTANKIGTYSLAVNARAHGARFYVVAPKSTFDLSLADGAGIPIEERPGDEVTMLAGRRVAPAGARVFSPAFDVTPADLIAGIVTEFGVISPVTAANVLTVLDRSG